MWFSYRDVIDFDCKILLVGRFANQSSKGNTLCQIATYQIAHNYFKCLTLHAKIVNNK